MPRATQAQFLQLWRRITRKEGGIGIWIGIKTEYTSPGRKYHTLVHIDHCLTEFDAVRHTATNPDAVELAIWFHDFVYNPKARDSEERSAEFIQEALRNVRVPEIFVEDVVELILATKHTSEPLPTHDMRLMVDIDLSIFGQPETIFDLYEEQIQQEYKHLSPTEFASGRAAFLKKRFLDRPPIYSTLFFRDKYEERALSNLTRSIARLTGA